MRIDRLLPPSEPGQRWTAALEGGGLLRLPERTVADFSLYSGMELSPQLLLDLEEAALEGRLREYAVNSLSVRTVSTKKLREKLTAKGATPEMAERVSDWAERIGLLNDEEYAKALARHYAAKGYGLYKIKDELYRRGVPREFWEEALAQLDDPTEQIQAFIEKKLTDPADRKQVKRVSDALVRRGYTWGQISAVLDGVRQQWEEA